jgi:WD40 repeat protein
VSLSFFAVQYPWIPLTLSYVDRFLSVDNSVYTYDLRKASSPIVKQESRQVLMETSDEINQVSLSCRGDLWVSAADDSGTVQLTNPVSGRRRVLHHDSDNVAMAMSAVFRPKRKDEVASGGTDCTVHLWDVNKPRYACMRSTCTLQC